MFRSTFQASCFQPRGKLRIQAVYLLISILTLAENVKAQTPGYTHFELTVNPPYNFSPGEHFSIEIEAKNVSAHTFTTGDVTVSFKGEVGCEVMTHNSTIKQLPKGSQIFSVEKQGSIRSEDLIVQALKDNWRPQQTVHFRLQLTTASTLPLTMLVRVAAKLKGRKELIFEPMSGVKDQQGLYAQSFLIMSKSYELDANGEIYEHLTTPDGIKSQRLFTLSPEAMKQNPRLLGVFDFDGDGTEEVFLDWIKEEDETPYDQTITHYQIYHKKVAREYVLSGEFELKGMPDGSVQFITEPDPKQPHKVLFVIQGGASWGTHYLLRRDGKSADEVFRAFDFERIDLNHDGIYELVVTKRPMVPILREIFRWNDLSFSYHRWWPPPGREDLVGGVWYDVDDDGIKEIIAVLADEDKPDASKKLSIYKPSNEAFTLISQTDLTFPYIEWGILGIRRLRDRKQIVLLLIDPQKEHGEQIVAGYDWKGGSLELAWLNDKIKTTDLPPHIIPAVDTDGDGQEEMQFEDKATGKPVILKGEKEFSQ